MRLRLLALAGPVRHPDCVIDVCLHHRLNGDREDEALLNGTYPRRLVFGESLVQGCYFYLWELVELREGDPQPFPEVRDNRCEVVVADDQVLEVET